MYVSVEQLLEYMQITIIFQSMRQAKGKIKDTNLYIIKRYISTTWNINLTEV